MEDDQVAARVLDLSEYEELVNTKDTETIDAFLSHIIHARMGTAYTGMRLSVMTQALSAEDGSLPQGLTIQNTYTKMCNDSKSVAIIVRNSMVYPQTLEEEDPSGKSSCGHMGARAISVIEVLDEAQGLQMPKLTVKQRQGQLFEKLDLSGLESWSLELADSAWSLLAEYYDIFSLEPSELCCMHPTKHVIKVTNDAPF